MCGIFGYVGKSNNAADLAFEALRFLEYRGYDSWGVGYKKKRRIIVLKQVGKLPIQSPEFDESHLAIGHCLAPDTVVQLSNGELRRISEVKSGEKVCTVNFKKLAVGNTKPVKVWQHKTPKVLYKVVTPFSTFKATENHRLFVALPNGKVVTKTVSNLSGEELLPITQKTQLASGKPFLLKTVPVEKHYVLTEKARGVLRTARKRLGLTRRMIERMSGIRETYLERIETGKRRSIEHEKLYKLLKTLLLEFDERLYQSANFKTNDIVLPVETSEELLQILGYHLGDGYCDKRFIRYKDSSSDVIKVYRKLYQSVFTLKGSIENKDTYYIFVCNSKFLVNWYRKNFPEMVSKTGKKDITSFVGTLPTSQIASFIKGIFDAEGTVGMRAGQVKLVMTDEIVVRKLQLLLLRFGILSTFSKNDRSKFQWLDAYNLLISDKESLEKFAYIINFSSRQKQGKLKKLIASMKGENYKYIKVPIRKDFLASQLQRYKVKINVLPEYYTTRSIKKLLEKLHDKRSSTYQKINKFLNSDIVWSRFKVEKVLSQEEFVYDLEVPIAENFIGNGFVQHNSRWATHGGVTVANAHPHLDCTKRVAVVHNGIVENFQELKDGLVEKGHKFLSETDTEVIVHLIEDFLKKEGFSSAVRDAFNMLSGLNAIVVAGAVSSEIIAAKNGSPLIVGVGKDGLYIASDATGILKHTNEVIFLEDNQMVILGKKVKLLKLPKGKEIKINKHILNWKFKETQRGKYKHYFIKEIHEEPAIIENTALNGLSSAKTLAQLIKNAFGTFFIACGSASYSAIGATYLFSKVAKKHVNFSIGSEFKYMEDFITPKTLVIPISQSGESIDVIEPVMRVKKQKGAKIAAIVNVLGSTLYRIADFRLLLESGPEKAVVATKSFVAMIAVLILTAYSFAGKQKKGQTLLNKAAYNVRQILSESYVNKIKNLSEKLKTKEHIYIIGRGLSYTAALEATLKIKEAACIHAEAFPAGELKHGVIALIEKGSPCIVFAPNDETYYDIISNAQEIRARGGYIIGVGPKNNSVFDEFLETDDIEEATLLPQITISHLLGYYLALARGIKDPDKPRNLAKSVTVK